MFIASDRSQVFKKQKYYRDNGITLLHVLKWIIKRLLQKHA